MNIILSAGIVVGLKELSSGGLESVGTIEVCAAIFSPSVDCTVDLDFELSLRTVNDSAGNVHAH